MERFIMIMKYSWLLYKRMMKFNKLLSFHYLLAGPLIGLVVYILFEENGGLLSTSTLSYVLFYIFLFQTFLITGKRVKNEFFFSSRCYNIFPNKTPQKFIYILVFGTVDLNVILYLIVALGMILFTTSWSFFVYAIFFLIFLVAEMAYLSYMISITEYLIGKYGTSKNLFLITFIPFMFLEFYTRLAEKYYLFEYYPISGWIGSTVNEALKANVLEVLFCFCIVLLNAFIGLFLLNKISFPRKYNVF
jgi:hypothetical protein